LTSRSSFSILTFARFPTQPRFPRSCPPEGLIPRGSVCAARSILC